MVLNMPSQWVLCHHYISTAKTWFIKTLRKPLISDCVYFDSISYRNKNIPDLIMVLYLTSIHLITGGNSFDEHIMHVHMAKWMAKTDGKMV